MKPPRLSLAISNTPSITPVSAVIRTRKTSITIRIAMEFKVCCTMVKMIHPDTISIRVPRMKDVTSILILTSNRRIVEAVRPAAEVFSQSVSSETLSLQDRHKKPPRAGGFC